MKEEAAGVGSLAPPATAVTLSVWRVKESFLVVSGERHGFSALPSSVHLKVVPATVDLNLKVGVRSLVFAAGFRVILVSG